MSDFINTIDLLGDEAVIDSLIDKSITEYRDNIITSLGPTAFAGCTLLKTIELPSVNTIGANAFYQGCNDAIISLPSIITLPSQGFAYSYCKGVRLSNVETITKYGFYYMGDLVMLVLDNPDKVCALEDAQGFLATQIDGQGTHAAQKNQGYVYVPKALVDTYKNATNWTTLAHKIRGIEDYTVGGTLAGIIILGDETEIVDHEATSVVNARFKGNATLVSVDLPNVTKLGSDAFHSCTSLKEVNLPLVETTVYAGNTFYNCTSLERISLPSLTFAQNYMFWNCTKLVEVDLPALETMASYVFRNTGLKRVTLPSVTTPGMGIFYECASLEEVCLPSATSINALAFRHCTKLSIIDLPSALEILNTENYGMHFQNCKVLKALILRSTTLCTLATPNVFGDASYPSGIFQGTGHIYVPRNLVESYKVATNWTTVANQFRALEDYTITGTRLGRLFFGDETEIVDDEATSVGESRFRDNTKITSINLSKATTIGRHSFRGCTSLTDVILPEATNFIESSFQGCTALESISLPKAIDAGTKTLADCTKLKRADLPELTTLGSYCFWHCEELTNVNLPLVNTAGFYAFYGCFNLKDIDLPSLTTVQGLFYDCRSLENVNIPLVTSLETNAFCGCSSLAMLDAPSLTAINATDPNGAFKVCSKLATLILRSTTLCTLADVKNFTETLIGDGTGYIYVPRALVNSYKTATNWSTFANQFRALEDYTVDGTITGALDESKI